MTFILKTSSEDGAISSLSYIYYDHHYDIYDDHHKPHHNPHNFLFPHFSDPPSVTVVERWLPQGRQMEVPQNHPQYHPQNHHHHQHRHRAQ